MQVLLSLNAPSTDANPPYFARTPAWHRRNLSTALGGWAELKHDLLLYSEQPMAAEMGGPGGGPPPPPPPPHQLGYVEPNLPFWQSALALLDFQGRALHRLHANTPHLDSLGKNLRALLADMHRLARKEAAHQPLTYDEMDGLARIGGEVEALTLRTLKLNSSDPLPERERQLALVSDVYAYNGAVLEEAVGAADTLYVVVEINGTPVLARGAVFSYYEFTSLTRRGAGGWPGSRRAQAGSAICWCPCPPYIKTASKAALVQFMSAWGYPTAENK